MSSKEYPSFVRASPRKLDLWSPVVTNDWSQDVSRGHCYAREMVLYLRRTGHIPFLHHVVKAMIGHGSWSGVEVGFFQLIAMEVVGSDTIRSALAKNHGYLEEEVKSSEAAYD